MGSRTYSLFSLFLLGFISPTWGSSSSYFSLFMNSHGVSYLSVDDPTIRSLSSAFSASAWFKLPYQTAGSVSPSGSTGLIFNSGAVATNGWNFQLKDNGSPGLKQFQLGVSTVFDAYSTITSTFTLDQWHHCAFIFTSDYKVTFFLDGLQFGDMIQGGGPARPAGGPLSIGYYEGFSTFIGHLDELAIFQYALNPVQLGTLYAGGIPGDLSGLTPFAWWRMGDGSGATAAAFTLGIWTIPDISGNHLDLSGTGFYESDRRLDSPGVSTTDYYNQYSLFWDTTAPGVVMNADNIGSLTSDFSVSLWFKLPYAWTRPANVVQFARMLSNDGWAVSLYSPASGLPYNSVTFTVYGIGDYTPTSLTITTDQWHHLVVTFDPSLVITYYLDGVQWATMTSDDYVPTGGSQMQIGKNVDEPWTGLLDEIVIFDTSIPSTTVTTIYNNGNPSNDFVSLGHIISWWRMGDESSASYSSGVYTIRDWSNNHYDMTFTAPQSALRVDTAGLHPVAAVSGGAVGDPVFSGFQGQHFEIHGLPNEYFTLWTTPTIHMNARFIYLDGVTHDIMKQSKHVTWTAKWTHPGTYLDDIGVLICNTRIHIHAQSWKQGLKINIQEQALSVGDIYDDRNNTSNDPHCRITVDFQESNRVVITQPGMFSWSIVNSHHFINLGATLLHPLLRMSGATHAYMSNDMDLTDPNTKSPYPAIPLHGLIGNTWRNATYPHNHAYQGDIQDYLIHPQQDINELIWSTNSYYSLYNYGQGHVDTPV